MNIEGITYHNSKVKREIIKRKIEEKMFACNIFSMNKEEK